MQFFIGEKKGRKKLPASIVSLFIMGYLKKYFVRCRPGESVMHAFMDSHLLQCGSDTHSCHLPKLLVKYQLISQVLEWNF